MTDLRQKPAVVPDDDATDEAIVAPGPSDVPTEDTSADDAPESPESSSSPPQPARAASATTSRRARSSAGRARDRGVTSSSLGQTAGTAASYVTSASRRRRPKRKGNNMRD